MAQKKIENIGGKSLDQKLLNELTIKIFADGANLESIRTLYGDPRIKGFTTNPTLMRNAGVEDYEAFAHEVLELIQDRPVSFEVLADDLDEMERQALTIASWGQNVVVKIPVSNTRGQFTGPIVRNLSSAGVQVNVTAIMTLDQVQQVCAALDDTAPAIVSLFAGRIADSGMDPLPVMAEALQILNARPNAELLWASPREVFNIVQADGIGCHIITVTNDLLKKMKLFGKNLEEFSLETVKMFYDDALSAGYSIDSHETGTLKRRA